MQHCKDRFGWCMLDFSIVTNNKECHHCILVGRAVFFPDATSCSSACWAANIAVKKLSCSIPLDDKTPKPSEGGVGYKESIRGWDIVNQMVGYRECIRWLYTRIECLYLTEDSSCNYGHPPVTVSDKYLP